MGAQQCRIDEMRIAQNDALRAKILQDLLEDIRRTYLAFKEDINDQNQLLTNRYLKKREQELIFQKRQSFHQNLKWYFGSTENYNLFISIMAFLHEDEIERSSKDA